jgi:hypothetical protein
MPKLDGTHLPNRLAARLADLKAGKEVAARDIRALLNEKQIIELENALKKNKDLKWWSIAAAAVCSTSAVTN